MRKILFAGNMDIWCRNSYVAKSSDEFTPTFSLSGRMLCTFISDKRKHIKQRIQHLHSSISPWQTTKEPPSRQHTFWSVSQVARHCFWKNSFSRLHLLPRKERTAQNNTIHQAITRIFLLPKSTLCKYSDYWEGDNACKENLRYHIVVITPL